MRYPDAKWNPSPPDCFTARTSRKIAVCDHRTVGWIKYLRTFAHLKEGRRISAHFTVALDGSVEQHVDTEHIAWTQGISKAQYDYAARNWPLFKQRNPNCDCIGIEHEDGAQPFNAERPMPEVQFNATVALHRWLFEHVIVGGRCIPGHTLISHDMLTTTRSGDPGAWLMQRLGATLGRKPRDLVSVRTVPADEDIGADLMQQVNEIVQRVQALEEWRRWDG